ncbi:MAG: hypothetical protein QOF21_43 [Actinomycetota bacterium]|jgi:hypothetical protein
MDRFEYKIAAWRREDDGTATLQQLNALGADGWEAVGMTTRAVPVPMAGMGAVSVPEIVVLLKRRRSE